MTSEEPNVQLAGRYSINDTCSLLKIHRNTLRKKTEQGLISVTHRRDGHDVYKGADILKFFRAQL